MKIFMYKISLVHLFSVRFIVSRFGAILTNVAVFCLRYALTLVRTVAMVQVYSLGIKRPGLEVDHSSPSSAKVKNVYRVIPLLSLQDFMA
jgi:hypothetical protein